MMVLNVKFLSQITLLAYTKVRVYLDHNNIMFQIKFWMVCCRRGIHVASVSAAVRGNAPVQSHPQEHPPRAGSQHRPLPATPTRLPLCSPR